MIIIVPHTFNGLSVISLRPIDNIFCKKEKQWGKKETKKERKDSIQYFFISCLTSYQFHFLPDWCVHICLFILRINYFKNIQDFYFAFYFYELNLLSSKQAWQTSHIQTNMTGF